MRAQAQPPPPPPTFQVMGQQAQFQQAQFQQGLFQPPPVKTNPSMLLGAQLAQLQLENSTRTRDRVDVLQANQMAMQANQLGMLRKQQLAAAELRV